MDNIQAGGKQFVHCLEVVPSLEVEMYGYRQGANSVSIVGRLSPLQSVHYRGSTVYSSAHTHTAQ